MNIKVGSLGSGRQVSLQNDTVVDTVPPDIPAQNLPGGDLRIPRDALDADLEFTIPKPLQEFEGDKLDVYILLKGDPTKDYLVYDEVLGPVDDRIWPLPMAIPVAKLVELATPETPTQYELVYQVFAGGANPTDPGITEYHIDKTKPYQTKTPATDLSPPAAAFPADLPPTQDIDDEYISNHQSGIEITLTLATSNAEATDTVDIYWGDPADPAYYTPVLSNEPVPGHGRITLPIDIFEDSNEGMNTLTFRVKDLAGNVSRESKKNQRNVRRLAPPVGKPPVVPLADGTDGDTLIDLADCDRGVTIEIEVPLPSSPNDRILASWKNIDLPPKTVGTETLLVFPVTFAEIERAYGVTDGPVPTKVSYVMLRGSGNPIVREETTIDVDISYPGPENPDRPKPVNPDFDLPRLVSSQDVDNILDDNDYGQEAKVYVQLYATPPTEAGQIVTVWYDDNELSPSYYLSPGEEGREILAATVPWDTIATKPNGIVKLKWVLSIIGGNNPVSSRDQDVNVDITKIDLPKPLVQGLIRNNISCPTLNFVPPNDGTSRRNLKVNIPPSPSLVDGKDVVLTWGGYTDEFATVPIPNTEVSVTHTVVGTVPPEGIELEIGDYFLNYKPVSEGYGKLTYTITGIVADSDEAIHRVFLLDNNGEYCEVANPIP